MREGVGQGLLLLVFLSSLCSTGGAEQLREGVQRAFLRSSEVATHCALEGQVGNQSVTLHTFLRISPGPTDGTLKAAGFAMLRGATSDDYYPLHMTQTDVVEHLTSRMFLRSPYTNEQYEFQVVVPDRRPRPGWGQPGFVEVIAMWGNWTLHHDDKPQQDFELRVDGFKWFCAVVSAPSPIAQGPSTVWPPPQDKAVARSSLGPGTKVWVLLTTFHESDPAAFAAMLQHHLSWHSRLGVHGYILYVQGWLYKLLRDPTIQALASQGRLIVILFDEMGRHEFNPLHPVWVDRYSHQVLLQNHGVLALWNSDALVVTIDLDEFLMTPQPLNVTEIFNASANGGPTPAGLVVMRRGMMCQSNVSADCCVATEAVMNKWAAFSPADILSGSKVHPITCLAMCASRTEGDLGQVKVIVDPNLTRGVFTHYVTTIIPGTQCYDASESVLRLAHIVNMYHMRHDSVPPLAEMRSPGQNWLWPADELSSKSRGNATK